MTYSNSYGAEPEYPEDAWHESASVAPGPSATKPKFDYPSEEAAMEDRKRAGYVAESPSAEGTPKSEDNIENPNNNIFMRDLVHYLCTGEASELLKKQISEYVASATSHPQLFGPAEPSYRPETLDTTPRPFRA